MLIRSQDKLAVFNIDNLIAISVGADKDNKPAIFITYGEKHAKIATYSAREKAIKVLDMLQEKYIEKYELRDMKGNIISTLDRAKIFQIPDENEVTA